MPPELVRPLPGYGPDVAANRAEARKLMEKQGYGPNNRLETKVTTRNVPPYRDPAKGVAPSQSAPCIRP